LGLSPPDKEDLGGCICLPDKGDLEGLNQSLCYNIYMLKIGVIRGGISSRYKDSLETGENVLFHLRQDKFANKYKPIDILIDKNGLWHMKGLPVSFEKIFNSVDVIFNALHGSYGEDGKIGQIFEQWNIPYTGSSPFASAISIHKTLVKERLHQIGVKVPAHILFPVFQEDFDGSSDTYPIRKAKEVWEKLPPPFIVRPLNNDNLMATHICKTFPELVSAIKDGMNNKVSILIEEFIEGKKVVIPVAEKFRKKDLYVFPPAGNFSRDEKRELEKLATHIHSNLGLGHYSLSEFVVKTCKGKPSKFYVTRVNSLPSLTRDSHMAKHLETVGSNMTEFIEHIISQAKK
jgi:D-alanine-D-alanine ligase-like ATP-grasp enzyme